MNYDRLISIVVPVYNAGIYLEKCVESILAQSYNCFELIMIDDGSKDNSWNILQEFACRDRRIRLIHQKNSGASAARNVGINAAVGQYLCFVDADDWVTSDYLLDMIRCMSSVDGAGVVVQGLKELNNKREILRIVAFPDRILRESEVGLAFTEIEIHKHGYSASKLYDLSLLNTWQIRFDETISHAEDMLFMIDFLKYADYIRFSSASNYIYESRGDSLSRNNRSYVSERKCYERMKANLAELASKYNWQMSEKMKMESVICVFLTRALPALFRPPYGLPRKERLRQLKSLNDTDFLSLERWYSPYRQLDKIGRWLLIRRFLWMYDCYMSFIFFVRYKIFSH